MKMYSYTCPFQVASSDHFLRFKSSSGQPWEATRATKQEVTQIQPVISIFCWVLNLLSIPGYICVDFKFGLKTKINSRFNILFSLWMFFWPYNIDGFNADKSKTISTQVQWSNKAWWCESSRELWRIPKEVHIHNVFDILIAFIKSGLLDSELQDERNG